MVGPAFKTKKLQLLLFACTNKEYQRLSSVSYKAFLCDIQSSPVPPSPAVVEGTRLSAKGLVPEFVLVIGIDLPWHVSGQSCKSS